MKYFLAFLLLWASPALATQQFLVSPTGSNQTFTSPADWNNASNTIELLAGGGSGGCSSGGNHNTGGGGGEYGKTTNFSFATPGTTTAVYRIGVGGTASVCTAGTTSVGTAGGDSWWNGTTQAGATLGAIHGGAGDTKNLASANGGAGGTGGVGTTHKAGGRGGNFTQATGNGGTGGGGAGGSTAAGNQGVDDATTGTGVRTAGGSADNGGTGAGGGGAAGLNGTDGGNGTEWDGTHGSGGGGGGAGNTSGPTATSGAGGDYGGGGGGTRGNSSFTATGSAGSTGIIVTTYTPTGVTKSHPTQIDSTGAGAMNTIIIYSGSEPRMIAKLDTDEELNDKAFKPKKDEARLEFKGPVDIWLPNGLPDLNRIRGLLASAHS